MVDFRYHLVSIVGIFLALGVGILLGSGTVGPFLERDIGRRLDNLERENDLRREQLEDARDFEAAVQPWLLDRMLLGREVAVVRFQGVDDDLLDGSIAVLEQAGGEVTSVITLTDRLSLQSPEDLTRLGAVVASPDREPETLLRATGEALGIRLAAAAGDRVSPPRESLAAERLRSFIDQLVNEGFAELDQRTDGPLVHAPSTFVILAGDEEPAPYEVGSLSIPLMETIARRGSAVVAGEGEGSTWDVVDAVRDGDSRDLISTVDRLDTMPGQVALVLALDADIRGPSGHYGFGSGASQVLPPPSP